MAVDSVGRVRPVPFGVWLFSLATFMQGAATVYALTHDGDRRDIVMGVTFLFFLTVTVTMYVRRPVIDRERDE